MSDDPRDDAPLFRIMPNIVLRALNRRRSLPLPIGMVKDDFDPLPITRLMHFDRQGKPIPLMEWARRFEDPAYKIIKQTTLPGGYKWVSTVWLGLDHNFALGGPPLIFETMVFGPRDLGPPDEYGRRFQASYDTERWSTEQEARYGHELVCKKWRVNRAARRKRARHETDTSGPERD